MARIIEVMSRERRDQYVTETAQADSCDEGFGIIGCDLNLRHWWVVYTR